MLISEYLFIEARTYHHFPFSSLQQTTFWDFDEVALDLISMIADQKICKIIISENFGWHLNDRHASIELYSAANNFATRLTAVAASQDKNKIWSNNLTPWRVRKQLLRVFFSGNSADIFAPPQLMAYRQLVESNQYDHKVAGQVHPLAEVNRLINADLQIYYSHYFFRP